MFKWFQSICDQSLALRHRYAAIMRKSDSEIGLVVFGLTPPYLEPSSHEALHAIALGILKSKGKIRRVTGGPDPKET